MIKVGDRVVCIKAHSDGETTIKGREYIVYGKKICECGNVVLDIGFKLPSRSVGTRCACNKIFTADIWWHRASCFRKVEERTNYVKLEIEIEEPILN